MLFKQAITENDNFLNAYIHNTGRKINDTDLEIAKNTTSKLRRVMNDYSGETPDHVRDAAERHMDNIIKYTTHDEDANRSYSRNISHALITGSPMTSEEQEVHNSIKAHAQPVGVDADLFSGVGGRLGRKIMGLKSGDTLHSPAHISTTTSHKIARTFAGEGGDESKEANEMRREDGHHVLHIHMQPHNKALYVGAWSSHAEEHETIIPSGTTLKYSHTERHEPSGKEFSHLRFPINVHHFTIHSQE